MTICEGIVQYFFHCPSSKLPIRDVMNEQGAGHKHEPHIEAGAENLLDSCYQRNISQFAKSNRDYLFLLTKCANPNLQENYGNQYIVGYIKRQETGEKQGRVFVRGSTKLFSFSDSVPVMDLFGWNFSRLQLLHKPYVDSRKTTQIMDSFSGKRNILEKCIHEIDIIDFQGLTCHPRLCGFKDECSRYAIYPGPQKSVKKSSCKK